MRKNIAGILYFWLRDSINGGTLEGTDESANLSIQVSLDGADYVVGSGVISAVKDKLGAYIGKYKYAYTQSESNVNVFSHIITHSDSTYKVDPEDIYTDNYSIPGGKMDLVDAPNSLAVGVIQSGLSKPSTAQTISSNSDITNIKINTDKLQFDGSNNVKSVKNATTAGISDFNTTEKASITAASPSSGDVILAASQPRYAPSKAGDAMALTSDERTAINTNLSSIHGAGLWGSGITYDNTITIITELTDHTRLPLTEVTCKSASGAGLQSVKTDVNGLSITTLPDGDITVLAWLTGYTFESTIETISGNTTITLTGTPIAIPIPEIGLQAVTFKVRSPNGNGYIKDAIVKAYISDEFEVSDVTISNQVTEAETDINGECILYLIKSGIFLIEIFADDERIRHKDVVITSDDVKGFETY